jgi:hypothetical protein
MLAALLVVLTALCCCGVCGAGRQLHGDKASRGRPWAVNYEHGRLKAVPLSASFRSRGHLASHLSRTYPSSNVGWAWYDDSYDEEGWDRLEVRIDDSAPFPNIVKARAAGFIEGNIQGPAAYR